MILRSPAEDENGRILFDPQTTISEEVRHSRMLLAGIQVEFGLDPRLRRSGVTALRAASLHPTPIFKGGHEGFMYQFLELRALRDLRGETALPRYVI
jgi:hypothetical protein